MKSSKHGKTILVSVENITPFGIWLFVKGREYFLSYGNLCGNLWGQVLQSCIFYPLHHPANVRKPFWIKSWIVSF